MKSFRRKYLRLLAFIVFPLLVLGCGAETSAPAKTTEEVKLNSGAVLKSENGEYKLYNYEDGQYKAMNDSKNILAYDKKSSSYILSEEGKYYVVHNGYKFNIRDDSYSALKMSPDASYISYFIEDEGLKLKIYETKNNNEIQVKSKVSISGTLYDWYDVDTLVYYGVSDDGINGLFTYNIKENKEELLYKIDQGYLAFLKGTVDNVLFLQITLENDKQLMAIDKKTKNIKMLTDKIEELSDIIVHNEKVYFTGKVKDDSNSLYELNDNKIKRLIFDFPNIVKIEKGLKIDENENILFIGSNIDNSGEERVYSYGKDKTISVLSKDSVDYVFIDYRN